MSDLFKTHLLNPVGIDKARGVGESFDALLVNLAACCPEGREFALAKTHLEQACFWSKKAIARLPAHQAPAEAPESKAERMFNAYNAQGPNPGKTWDGKDVPPWSGLNDQVRGKWIAAAAVALLLFLVPGSAFADGLVESTTQAAPTPWWVPLVLGFFGILSTVITTVVLPAWKRLIDARAAAEDAKGARTLLTTVAIKAEHFAELTQANIDATMLPALAKALEDGKVSTEEGLELRALALRQMKIMLGTVGIAELKATMGLADEVAVDNYLLGMVEKKIDQLNAAAAGRPSTPVIQQPAPSRP